MADGDLPIRAGGSLTEPHFESAALLTVDIQSDTVEPGGPWYDPDSGPMLMAAAGITRAWRSAGRHIVHVVRLYEEDGSNVDRCRKDRWADGWRAVVPETPGAELAEELKPNEDVRLAAQLLLSGEFQLWSGTEAVMYKPRWSAFFGTSLERFLTTRRIDTVVVVGHMFQNCVRATIQDATANDFRTVAVADAISGSITGAGLEELAAWGVEITTAYDVIDQIARVRADF